MGSDVPLPAVPFAPGWASGPVHRVDDPNRWASGRGIPEVLALPGLWWPSPQRLPPTTIALVLHGVPRVRADPGPPPAIAGVDADLLREGERVDVDGSNGTFTIAGVEEVPVVTALLERDDGRILLLERSEKVGSYRHLWAGISGYLEEPTALDQAYREIREEVGVDASALQLAAQGAPILARDDHRVFVVHPFRFRVGPTDLRLDWEHVRAEWVDPAEIRRRPTVPKLDRVWEAIRPGAPPKG